MISAAPEKYSNPNEIVQGIHFQHIIFQESRIAPQCLSLKSLSVSTTRFHLEYSNDCFPKTLTEEEVMIVTAL